MTSAQVDELLCRAIAARCLVSLVYDGLPRIGEPHDYGLRAGKAQLNFYQTGGRSRSGKLPSWRTLDVARISELETLDKEFAGTRDTSTARHLRWDEVYASVTLRASK